MKVPRGYAPGKNQYAMDWYTTLFRVDVPRALCCIQKVGTVEENILHLGHCVNNAEDATALVEFIDAYLPVKQQLVVKSGIDFIIPLLVNNIGSSITLNKFLIRYTTILPITNNKLGINGLASIDRHLLNNPLTSHSTLTFSRLAK